MLSKTFYLLFFLRKPQNYSTGKLPIFVRFTGDGNCRELATKRSCSERAVAYIHSNLAFRQHPEFMGSFSAGWQPPTIRHPAKGLNCESFHWLFSAKLTRQKSLMRCHDYMWIGQQF